MTARYQPMMKRAACTTLGLAISGLVQAATPAREAGSGPIEPPSFPAALVGVLYSQLDNASGNGAPAQDFEAAFDTYDNEAADDFVVPTGQTWSISGVNVVGTIGNRAALQFVRVWFYSDNAGFPAAAATCTYTNLTPTGGTGGNLELTLPTPCVLPAGNHWVALQVRGDFSTMGQFFWSNRSTQTNNESVWRNPGNGFATDCVNWGRQRACGVGGGESPDFLFEIIGEQVRTRPVPALGPWAAAGLSSALGALGFAAQRRRRKGVGAA